MVAIQLITNCAKSINTATRLVTDIRKMLELDWEVHLQHMLREGNRATDALVNIGILLPLGLQVFEVAPKDVHEIALQDVMSVPFNRLCV